MSEPLDPETIANLRELAGDDKGFVAQMVELYVRTTAEKLPAITTALQERRFKDVASQCHQLKSSSGNLGALALGALFERLETAALASDGGEAARLLTEVTASYLAVETALKKL